MTYLMPFFFKCRFSRFNLIYVPAVPHRFGTQAGLTDRGRPTDPELAEAGDPPRLPNRRFLVPDRFQLVEAVDGLCGSG